MLIDIITF